MPTPPARTGSPQSRVGSTVERIDTMPLAIPLASAPGSGRNLNAPVDFAPPNVPRADGPASVPTAELQNSQEVAPLDLDDTPPEDELDRVGRVLLAAPPWLVSLLVHMLGLVLLGLLLVPNLIRHELRLEVLFADAFGQQLEEDVFSLEAEPEEQLALNPADLTAVDDPLASVETNIEPLPDQSLASSFESPQIGLALTGREPGMKDTLLLAYGGSRITEGAVGEALRWLAKNQRRDGSWSLRGPYQDGAVTENKVAATAMALLAFQGAGFTHEVTRPMLNHAGERKEVDYRREVDRGWDAMLGWLDKDGSFWKKGNVSVQHHVLYSQAMGTIAICELYGMTKDERFRRPAQRAIDYAVRIQDTRGGWRYTPGADSDTSVTGWFVMALQSARMAGLEVPSEVFEKISRFLDTVTDDGGSRYGYLPGYASKLSMTAEALLCRQYLGWPRDDERLQQGVAYVANNPIDWNDTNSYYWYYATQVMHHMEGDQWLAWNRVMAQEIPAKQVTEGREKGSWSPGEDRWAMGGRLYMTCLCTYMLEVYYRHLPIYAQLY